MDWTIERDDPRRDDVVALLEAHLTLMYEITPADHVHALDLDGLCVPEISFFSCRREGVLLAVGALKRIDDGHAELKSMHTAVSARGSGIGAAMVEHLVAEARAGGICRLSLETGSQEAFGPARRLYARFGFEECGPFGDYDAAAESAFMTRVL